MKLICDKCGKTYTFPDKGLKGRFFAGAPHSLMPIGQREGCTGTLQSDRPAESTQVDFRALVRESGVRFVSLRDCPAGIPPINENDSISHAHSSSTDPDFGTICLAPGENMDGILHELAHIQAPDDGHGPVWRGRMKALGLDPMAAEK